jgi:4'-phosphopantetheinyl transferase EntD
MAQAADIERDLAEPFVKWLGSDCLAFAAPIHPDNEDLLQPEERRCIAQAVATRRAEFATGRALARRAFIQLGLPADRLIMLEDRAPKWPTACEASLSHAGGYCLFAARPRSGYGIGVDLEVVAKLDEHSRALILTEREQSRFGALPGGWDGPSSQLAALQAFSMKEALFKAMHGMGNRGLDFRAIELFPNPDDSWTAFAGEDFQQRLPAGMQLSVWSARVSDFIVSAAALSG